MSDTRRRILDDIRRALGPTPADQDLDALRARDVVAHTAPRPVWRGTTLERFATRIDAAAGSLATVTGWSGVTDAVAAFAHDYGVGDSLRLDVADHDDLAGLGWPEGWDVQRGATPRRDSVMGLARGFAGVAETGSVALFSGPSSPAMLNSLPEYFVVALGCDEVVDYLEDLWVRARARSDFPPRALNLVTGPSRTADVEQTLQLGAHGPRQMRVILVG